MKKLLGVSVVASAMVLSGCATDSNTANHKVNKAAVGALIGAASGAAISKSTGGENTGRDAFIGAIVGAGIGAGAEKYMERQEEKLKEQTAGTGIEVVRDTKTNNINLVMPESITFDVARADIKPAFYRTLNQIATTLGEYNQTTVVVKGHASSEGNINYNQNLSQNRANSVAYYLMQRGIASHRIRAIGYGISQPIASNATEYGRMQNRRVEITIHAPQNIR